jgi:hypothetical protein
LLGLIGGIHLKSLKLHFHPAAKVKAKSGVLIGFRAAQAMVYMNSRNRPKAIRHQKMQQSHRIRAAGETHNHIFAGLEHIKFVQSFKSKFFQELFHDDIIISLHKFYKVIISKF